MACTSGCPTPGAHRTWGECARAKSTRVGYCQDWKGLDYSRQRRWDGELDLYASARRQGIQPDGTRTHAIRKALDISDKTGTAYRAVS